MLPLLPCKLSNSCPAYLFSKVKNPFFLLAIRWPLQRTWHKTLITVPYVGKKWKQQENSHVLIYSTSNGIFILVNRFLPCISVSSMHPSNNTLCFLCSSSCLQSWLEQDTSCPTCRLALSMQSPMTRDHSHLDHTLLAVDGGADGVQATRRPPANHFFHFDGAF